MRLNHHSYVHKLIRYDIALLEAKSGLKLATSLNGDIQSILFFNELSYLRIDVEQMLCFSMSHSITKEEAELIEDIIFLFDWLRIGEIHEERRQQRWQN